MTLEHFTIDQVSWHTKRIGTTVPRERTIERFYHLAKFLQDNNLTSRIIMGDINDVNDDFQIHTKDLTEEGYALIKAAYDKWLRRVDRTKDSSDVRILERALKTLREG